MNRHAGIVGACERVARIVGLRLAEQDHFHRLAGVLQADRRIDAIAAVVARARDDADQARMRRQRQGKTRHGGTGALHQGMRRQRRQGCGFDAPRVGDVEQRQIGAVAIQAAHQPRAYQRSRSTPRPSRGMGASRPSITCASAKAEPQASAQPLEP